MNRRLPIAPPYRAAVFDAVALQVLVGVLSLLILDGGNTARVCGIALLGFWGGAAVWITRRPQPPSKRDLQLIRFGYLPVVAMAFVLVPFIWSFRPLP